jgi:hypothetical protein
MQQYLSVAREMYSQSRDGEEMKSKMIRAFPDFGGVGCWISRSGFFS